MARLIIQSESGPAPAKELNLGVTRVGRGDDNDLILLHSSVSFHHCLFELGLDSLVLRDCGSTNGTFVNEQRIQEATLAHGQRLRFGQVSAVVEWQRADVVVPVIEAPHRVESVPLPNGVMSCRTHQATPSVWHCPKCQQYFCGRCVRGVNLVGRSLHKLCPLCSGHVQLPPWAEDLSRKTSMWTRVKKALNRTIRMK